MGAIQRTERETLQNETVNKVNKMNNTKYFNINNGDILVNNIEVFSFVIAAVTNDRVYNKALVAKVLKAVGAPVHADLAQFGAQEKAIIESLKATFLKHGMLSQSQAANVNKAFAAICYAITNTIMDFFYQNDTVGAEDMAAVVAIFDKYFTAQVQSTNIEGIEAAATEYNFHDFDVYNDGRASKVYNAQGQCTKVKLHMVVGVKGRKAQAPNKGWGKAQRVAQVYGPLPVITDFSSVIDNIDELDAMLGI